MIADFVTKVGDTEPALIITCLDQDSAIIPLTAVSEVKFSMIDPGTATPKISQAAATVMDGPNGKLRYNWTSGDVDTAGVYNGEFRVVWSAGGETKFPNNRYIVIKILPKIA